MPKTHEHIIMDTMDKKILREMQRNARISNIELADKVGLSPTPCLRRVKQLEASGIIDRYTTLLKPEALGYDLQVYVAIEMDRHTPDRFNSFEQAIRTMDEVMECNIVTGQSADYLLKILVKDMRDYEHFLLDRLTKIEGVSGVHSSFVLRKIVDKIELPLNG